MSILCIISLIACTKNNTNNDPNHFADENTSYCAAAETHLKDLGCISKTGPYTVKNKSFKQFCEETIKNGVNLNPHCISQISSCDQINACVQG